MTAFVMGLTVVWTGWASMPEGKFSGGENDHLPLLAGDARAVQPQDVVSGLSGFGLNGASIVEAKVFRARQRHYRCLDRQKRVWDALFMHIPTIGRAGRRVYDVV